MNAPRRTTLYIDARSRHEKAEYETILYCEAGATSFNGKSIPGIVSVILTRQPRHRRRPIECDVWLAPSVKTASLHYHCEWEEESWERWRRDNWTTGNAPTGRAWQALKTWLLHTRPDWTQRLDAREETGRKDGKQGNTALGMALQEAMERDRTVSRRRDPDGDTAPPGLRSAPLLTKRL